MQHDNGTVTKEPTQTEEGEMTYTCQNDAAHTTTKPIAKLAANDSQTNTAGTADSGNTQQQTPAEPAAIVPEAAAALLSVIVFIHRKVKVKISRPHP